MLNFFEKIVISEHLFYWRKRTDHFSVDDYPSVSSKVFYVYALFIMSYLKFLNSFAIVRRIQLLHNLF